MRDARFLLYNNIVTSFMPTTQLLAAEDYTHNGDCDRTLGVFSQ